MKLGIVIPTYWKPDGSTVTHLRRALDSIKSQSFQDYKVYVIGDKYENHNEFESLSKIIDKNKITSVNLDRALAVSYTHLRAHETLS
jgi:hypothetical protein